MSKKHKYFIIKKFYAIFAVKEGLGSVVARLADKDFVRCNHVVNRINYDENGG